MACSRFVFTLSFRHKVVLADHATFQGIDYAKIDWDESLDPDNDREAEDRWFDDDDDS